MSIQEWSTTEVFPGSDQALELELVRATEAAAIVAGRGVGRDRWSRDRAAATVAMHEHLMSVPMRGTVVVDAGENYADTPVLCTGDSVGRGDGANYDLGVGVGDGALSPAKDVPNSMAAIVLAERGALYAPPPSVAMKKLAVGADCADVVDITQPVAANLRAVAAVKGVRVADLVVAVLNRSWHRELVNQIRAAGARIHMLEGGDIAGAIATACPESSVDMLMGTGGAAEGVIAAAALSCLGGSLQVRLRSEGPSKVLHTGDLVRGGRVVFCATGVTTSEFLRGVQRISGLTITQSMVLCSTPDTARLIRSEHRFA